MLEAAYTLGTGKWDAAATHLQGGSTQELSGLVQHLTRLIHLLKQVAKVMDAAAAVQPVSAACQLGTFNDLAFRRHKRHGGGTATLVLGAGGLLGYRFMAL